MINYEFLVNYDNFTTRDYTKQLYFNDVLCPENHISISLIVFPKPHQYNTMFTCGFSTVPNIFDL